MNKLPLWQWNCLLDELEAFINATVKAQPGCDTEDYGNQQKCRAALTEFATDLEIVDEEE